MSSQQILSVAGTVIGAYVGFQLGGPAGAQWGAAIGGSLGGYAGASMDRLPDIRGPQMQDRKIQLSTYGVSECLIYGPNVRVAGNIGWFKGNKLDEVANTDDTGGKSGQPAQSTTFYTYFATFALFLSANETRAVRRIWAGGMLLYDGGLINQVQPNFGLTFYRGTADQLPDPVIEAEKGVGSTPAYRGKSYLVFDSMPVEKTGWPTNFTVELSGAGEFDYQSDELGVAQEDAWVGSAQRLDGNVITAQQIDATLRLSIIDQQTGAVLLTVDHAGLTADSGGDSNMCYVPPLNEVWLAGGTDGIFRFDGSSLAHLGDIFNGAGGGSSRMVWDPVRQRVFHRPNAQWLRAGGQNVLLAGALTATDIISGEDSGYIALDYTLGYETMDAIVGSYSAGGLPPCNAAYDPMRRRYVAVDSSGNLRSVTDSTSPVVTVEVTGAHAGGAMSYDASTDCILQISQLVGLTHFTSYDAETLAVKVDYDEASDTTERLRLGFMDFYPDTTTTGRVFVIGYYAAGNKYQPWSFNYFASSVGACVADLCERSGLEAGDIDVSDLTQTLRGYVISQVDSARPAIEQLASVFAFTAVEEDDKLVFKRRGSDSVATITRAECGATEGDSEEPPTAITATRADQLDLPSRCFVTAPDPARDLQPNTQQSQRQAASAGQPRQINVAVSLTATEAVRLANFFMYDAWASRTPFEFSTDMRYTRLMPGDVVMLDGKRVLLLERYSGDAVINWKGVSDDASVLTQYGIGIGGDFPVQLPPQTVPTYEILLDIPLLSDAEDSPGAYVAAWGIAPHWRGGVLYRSLDEGVSWAKMAVFPKPGISIGDAVNALGDFGGGNVFDEVNPLTVRMRNGIPYSTTRDAVLAGSNALAIASGDGWEIVPYRDVTTNPDGSYTLRGLLRGRLGSEWAMPDHAVGDVVVLLATSTLRDFAIEASEIGVPQLTKAVSIGSTLSDTDSEEVTISSERLKPWSPCDFRVSRDEGTGAATLTWKRRTRLSCRFTGAGGIYVPLGEATEEYELEIWSPGFVTLLRTITGLTSPEYLYSLADQDDDGQIHGDAISVRIYQISAIVGRGHPFEARAGRSAGPITVGEVPAILVPGFWSLHFIGQLGAADATPIKVDQWNAGAISDMEFPYTCIVDGSVTEVLDGPDGNMVGSSNGDWPFSDARLAFGQVGLWVGKPTVVGEYPILTGFGATFSCDPEYNLTTGSFAGVGETNTGPRNWDLRFSGEGYDDVLIHSVRDQSVFDPGDLRSYYVKHTGLNFYRLRITETADGTIPRITQLQLFEYGSETEVTALGGFGDSSGSYFDETHQGDQAFHGGSGWRSAGDGPWWLRYELAESHEVGRYGITVDEFSASVAPRSWTLEVSVNGVDWTIVDRRENEMFADGVTRDFILPRRIEFIPT